MGKSTKRADLIALGVEVQELAGHADSIMVSLSKGLGVPVGSVVGGTADFMKRTRRYRKMPGVGMRQTRWLASCGLNAFSDENIARLRDDHENARFLAQGLARLPAFSLDLARVHTNLVLARFEHSNLTAARLLSRMEERGEGYLQRFMGEDSWARVPVSSTSMIL